MPHSAQPGQPPQVHFSSQAWLFSAQNGLHVGSARSAHSSQPQQPPQSQRCSHGCVLPLQKRRHGRCGGGRGGGVGAGGFGGGDSEHAAQPPQPFQLQRVSSEKCDFKSQKGLHSPLAPVSGRSARISRIGASLHAPMVAGGLAGQVPPSSVRNYHKFIPYNESPESVTALKSRTPLTNRGGLCVQPPDFYNTSLLHSDLPHTHTHTQLSISHTYKRMHIWIASRSVPSLHPRAGAECKLIIFCVGPFLPMATASVSYEKSFTFLYFILYSVFFLAPSGHKQGTGRAFDRSIDVHKTSERDQNISLSTYDERAAAIAIPARGRAFCWFS